MSINEPKIVPEITEAVPVQLDVTNSVQQKAEKADKDIESNRLKLVESLANQEGRTYQQLEQKVGKDAVKPVMESVQARFGKPSEIRDPESLRGHQFQMRQLEKMGEAGTDWGFIEHGKMFGKEPYMYINGSDGFTYAKTPNAPLQKLNPTTGEWDRVQNIPGGFNENAFNQKYAQARGGMNEDLLRKYDANNTLEERFLKPGFDKDAIYPKMSWNEFNTQYKESTEIHEMNKQVADRFNLLNSLGVHNIPRVDLNVLTQAGLSQNAREVTFSTKQNTDVKESTSAIEDQGELKKYLEQKLKEFEEAFKKHKAKKSESGSNNEGKNSDKKDKKNKKDKEKDEDEPDFSEIPQKIRNKLKRAVQLRIEEKDGKAEKKEGKIEDILEEGYEDDPQAARKMLKLMKKYLREATNGGARLKIVELDIEKDEGEKTLENLEIDIEVDEDFDIDDADWDVQTVDEDGNENEGSEHVGPRIKKREQSEHRESEKENDSKKEGITYLTELGATKDAEGIWTYDAWGTDNVQFMFNKETNMWDARLANVTGSAEWAPAHEHDSSIGWVISSRHPDKQQLDQMSNRFAKINGATEVRPEKNENIAEVRKSGEDALRNAGAIKQREGHWVYAPNSWDFTGMSELNIQFNEKTSQWQITNRQGMTSRSLDTVGLSTLNWIDPAKFTYWGIGKANALNLANTLADANNKLES